MAPPVHLHAVTWLIPGTLAVGLAFATTFITLGPMPSGAVKVCTQIAVMADHRVIVADCEGPR